MGFTSHLRVADPRQVTFLASPKKSYQKKSDPDGTKSLRAYAFLEKCGGVPDSTSLLKVHRARSLARPFGLLGQRLRRGRAIRGPTAKPRWLYASPRRRASTEERPEVEPEGAQQNGFGACASGAGCSAQCPRRTRFRQWAQVAGMNSVALGAMPPSPRKPPREPAATVQDLPRQRHLRRGVSLLYKKKKAKTFVPNIFTYSDYQDKKCIEMFIKAREFLKLKK